MKLLVLGPARHGKDTVSEMLCKKLGLTFTSSSIICCEAFIFDRLKKKYGYNTVAECFNDRVNHRAEWFDMICEYNKNDGAKLGKLIFSKDDIYCGLRNMDEFIAIQKQNLFDCCIWVDASKRMPPEPETSITVTRSCADFVIDNNLDLEFLEWEVDGLCKMLKASKG